MRDSGVTPHHFHGDESCHLHETGEVAAGPDADFPSGQLLGFGGSGLRV